MITGPMGPIDGQRGEKSDEAGRWSGEVQRLANAFVAPTP